MMYDYRAARQELMSLSDAALVQRWFRLLRCMENKNNFNVELEQLQAIDPAVNEERLQELLRTGRELAVAEFKRRGIPLPN